MVANDSWCTYRDYARLSFNSWILSHGRCAGNLDGSLVESYD